LPKLKPKLEESKAKNTFIGKIASSLTWGKKKQ